MPFKGNKFVEDIPDDFCVKPLNPKDKAKDRATCGHCKLSWDDAIGTEYTPAPSARCPFEYFHIHPEEAPDPNIGSADERTVRMGHNFIQDKWIVIVSKDGHRITSIEVFDSEDVDEAHKIVDAFVSVGYRRLTGVIYRKV